MNESPTGTESGRKVYKDLLQFKKQSSKEVQVLASHSHFLMSDVYKTSCRKDDSVLPGWIVGTATRYRLPVEHASAKAAMTDVYGYLLGTVDANGHITFSIHEITASDVSPETRARYSNDLVQQCFVENKNTYVADGPTYPKRHSRRCATEQGLSSSVARNRLW